MDSKVVHTAREVWFVGSQPFWSCCSFLSSLLRLLTPGLGVQPGRQVALGCHVACLRVLAPRHDAGSDLSNKGNRGGMR